MSALARRTLLLFFVAGTGFAAPVRVLCDRDDPQRSLFPSDRFTVRDRTQNTGLRVSLPKPSCTERPSDCADVDVLNTLDGFNLQPRLSIPFSGPIDVTTVSGRNVFLLHLGSTRPGGGRPGSIVGVNQIVWDPVGFRLFAESDALLERHTRYALVVTNGVRDAAGAPVRGCEAFAGASIGVDDADGLAAALARHRLPRVVAATIFTTQSSTSTLEQIRRQIKASSPTAVDFALGAAGSRTVFPVAQLTGIVFRRQIATSTFAAVPVPVAALNAVPGAVATVAFGRYRSPDYETPAGFIPPVGTRTGVPAVQRVNDIDVTFFLPSGTPPANGWPIAIFGHGLGDNKNNSPFAVASVLAAGGVATAAINVVGHGGGPLGTLEVGLASGGAASLSAGGRASDQNGDGQFGPFEGASALPPRTLLANRDGLRQTVVDLMQLVRQIEQGVDVDGNGSADLDRARVYYFGQSFGGIYGTLFLAVEPTVRAGVPNVAGGSIAEIARLGTFRPLVTELLAFRIPSLLNAPGGFNENLPLRNQPPVVNTVPGALPIQEFLDRMEWASQSANPAAYARHLRTAPLPGVPRKPVILQFAKGDQTVPNPTNTAIIRAGQLADRTTFFRNDLAFAADPTVPKNSHGFLTRLNVPSVAAIAVGAQRQIATFFASDGTVVIDPDGPGPLFEVPIVPPLPEDLSFIP